MGEKKTKGREARKRERERKYKRLFIKGQRKVESCQGLNFISLMQKHQEQQQQVANMQVREQQNILL